MFAFRLLILLTAVAVAVCLGGFLISGDRRYVQWAYRVVRYAVAAAIIFLAIELLERVV